MRWQIFFAGLFLAVQLFTGCNKENTTEPISTTQKSLLPLSVGNTWNFKLYNHTTDSAGQVNWSINSVITIDTTDYYLISSSGFGTNDFVARKLEDGIVIAYYDSVNGMRGYSFFKHPAENNEVYQFQIPGTDSTVNMKVEIGEMNLAGQVYQFYGYYNLNLNPHHMFMFFSENIGLIRHKTFFVGPQGMDTTKYFIYDLQSYTVNH